MYPADLSRRVSDTHSGFRNTILTRVWVLNIKVKPVDDSRDAMTLSTGERIEGTGAIPLFGDGTVGFPQKLSEGLSVLLASQGVGVGSTTEGQKHYLSLGLTVLDILSHIRAMVEETVVGRVINAAVAGSIVCLGPA